ncbi:MAG: hypothetical protein KAG20_09170 [Cocleimonas sp.]|nr:hypothetical protein [Cocleimonas sp.]
MILFSFVSMVLGFSLDGGVEVEELHALIENAIVVITASLFRLFIGTLCKVVFILGKKQCRLVMIKKHCFVDAPISTS